MPSQGLTLSDVAIASYCVRLPCGFNDFFLAFTGEEASKVEFSESRPCSAGPETVSIFTDHASSDGTPQPAAQGSQLICTVTTATSQIILCTWIENIDSTSRNMPFSSIFSNKYNVSAFSANFHRSQGERAKWYRLTIQAGSNCNVTIISFVDDHTLPR